MHDGPRLDCFSFLKAVREDRAALGTIWSAVLDRVVAYPDPAVWTYRLPQDRIRDRIRDLDRLHHRAGEMPLYGVPFAVKDNFDVERLPTTAGCPGFSYVAKATAPVVQRLLDAGAVLVGKTNMDQFAAGLAGDRTPYGCCGNVFDGRYVAGGSSSGSAVAVGAGLVGFALATDTAGSGRVPAACSNIVGLKPAPGELDTQGVVPACESLDCVAVFSLTVNDALLVRSVAGGRTWSDTRPGRAGIAVASPHPDQLDLETSDGRRSAFGDAILRLTAVSGSHRHVDFRAFAQVAGLLYDGPWLAERLTAVGGFLADHPDQVHPVTLSILRRGFNVTGVDVFRGLSRLRRLREECSRLFRAFEVLVVPTVPAIPTRDEAVADSQPWSRRLGTYTNFSNLLGLAAIALPAGFTPAGLPHGITLLAPPERTGLLDDLALRWERELGLSLGATGFNPPPVRATPGPARQTPEPPSTVRVAVAGAHLRGQPLHEALLGFGATFVGTARTASGYRFVALMGLSPARPGLVRDDSGAGGISVELYDLPVAGFGELVRTVGPPLAIGTVTLDTGESVKGFLCESYAAASAVDVTHYGGWAAYRTAGSSRDADGVASS